MAEFDPRSSDGSLPDAAPTAPNPETLGSRAQTNHASAADATHSATNNVADDRSGLDRAEEMVDSLAAKLSTVASSWGRQLLRLSSRARESLQDFWAEVQDVRHGKKP
jgi:hypothetical protein